MRKVRFTNESFEEIIHIARDDVKHMLEGASLYPDREIQQVVFYLQVYAVHLTALIAYNGYRNGVYKTPDEGLIRMKALLDIEHAVIGEWHEEGNIVSVEEMKNEQGRISGDSEH